MSTVSRAQKLRLGIFLFIGTTLLIGTIVVMIGMAALKKTDQYVVRFSGSVGGLSVGQPVDYNGIRIGRVESILIDPENVEEVEITLSIEAGTPIKEDTVATINMQGITGLKYIELSGGTNAAKTMPPGSEIQPGGSDFDLLTRKASTIANEIELLLKNLNKLTDAENQGRFDAILADIQGNVTAVRGLVESQDIKDTLHNVRLATDEVVEITQEVKTTVVHARTTLDQLAGSINTGAFNRIFKNASAVLTTLNKRLGDDELGVTITRANTLLGNSDKLVKDLDITVVRSRDDLRRVLEVLITAGENLADFTQILVDNPSALISGRSEEDRALP